MSIQLHHAALSVGASVDQQTGNLSVFDVIEEVRTPQLPVHLQSVVISLAWRNLDGTAFDGRMVVDLVTPDGGSTTVGSGDLKIAPEQKRVKAVLRFGGFPVQAYGDHAFVVSWLDAGGKKAGSTRLEFEVLQITQVAQAPAPGRKPPVTH